MSLAAAIAPVAVLFAAGSDAHPFAVSAPVEPVVAEVEKADAAAPACCMELVAAPAAVPAVTATGQPDAAPAHFASASRWRVAERQVQRVLPVGIAPERGLQVKTILVARSISVVFPEIQQIGGVRPDALRWHPNGLALDVMIPNPGSAEGIALGNQIVAYVMKNADRFGIQDAIWRGVYYTPNGARGTGMGHYDHVHVTTTGGGYPTGSETYYR